MKISRICIGFFILVISASKSFALTADEIMQKVAEFFEKQ